MKIGISRSNKRFWLKVTSLVVAITFLSLQLGLAADTASNLAQQPQQIEPGTEAANFAALNQTAQDRLTQAKTTQQAQSDYSVNVALANGATLKLNGDEIISAAVPGIGTMEGLELQDGIPHIKEDGSLEVTNPGGTVSQYDKEGRIVSQRDSKGQVATYAYNADGTVTSSYKGATAVYNKDANLLSVTQPDGTKTTYEGNFVKEIEYKDGTKLLYIKEAQQDGSYLNKVGRIIPSGTTKAFIDQGVIFPETDALLREDGSSYKIDFAIDSLSSSFRMALEGINQHVEYVTKVRTKRFLGVGYGRKRRTVAVTVDTHHPIEILQEGGSLILKTEAGVKKVLDGLAIGRAYTLELDRASDGIRLYIYEKTSEKPTDGILIGSYKSLNQKVSFSATDTRTVIGHVKQAPVFKHDKDGKLVKHITQSGGEVDYTAPNAATIKFQDWNKSSTSYSYDEASKTTTISRDGLTRRYDNAGTLISAKLDTGLEIFYEDAKAVRIITKDKEGTSVTITNPVMDAQNNIVGGEAEYQNGTRRIYKKGLITYQHFAEGQDAWTDAWYEKGKLIKVSRSNGDIRTYTYANVTSDPKDEVMIETNPLTPGALTKYQYGRAIFKQDVGGNIEEFFYDSEGKLITSIKTPKAGLSQRTSYKEEGGNTYATSASGEVSVYDKDNKLVRQVSSEGLITEFSYNEDGTQIRSALVKDKEEGYVNTITYDKDVDGSSIVKDEFGTKRIYDKSGALAFIETANGIGYRQRTLTIEEGGTTKQIKEEPLAYIRLDDGSRVHYEDGMARAIYLADGSVATDLSFSQGGRLIGAAIASKDGTIKTIKEGLVVKLALPDGTIFEYEYAKDRTLAFVIEKSQGLIRRYDAKGRLVRYFDGEGKDSTYSYTAEASGAAEEILTGYKSIGGYIPKVPITITSTSPGFMDRGRARVYVNGKPIKTQISSYRVDGYKIVVIDEATGQVIDAKSFNNHAASGNVDKMTSFLSSIPNGKIVVVAVEWDGAMNMTKESYAALASIGSQRAYEQYIEPDPEKRLANARWRSWAIIGRKGISSGEAIEGLSEEGLSEGGVSVSSFTQRKRDLKADDTSLLKTLSPDKLAIQDSKWQEVMSHLEEVEGLGSDVAVNIEYDDQGQIASIEKLNGTITVYENGRVSFVTDKKKNLLSSYTYDSDGELIKVTLHYARKRLTQEVSRSKLEIENRKAEALRTLLSQKAQAMSQAVSQAYSQINSEMSGVRSQFSSARNQLIQAINDLENTRVHGRANKKAKSQQLDELRRQFDGLNQEEASAMSRLSNELAALAPRISAEVEEEANRVKNEIESQAKDASDKLEVEKEKMEDEFLKQEVYPIIFNQYRGILGRDPDTTELEGAFKKAKGQKGLFDVYSLKRDLERLSERGQKQLQKERIIKGVESKLSDRREGLLQYLGLSQSEVKDITKEDLDKILTFLKSQNLHFGSSAFLALQRFLSLRAESTSSLRGEAEAISYEELATKALLIDILTGVLTPKSAKGELVISLYALKKTAESYGATGYAVKLTVDELTSQLQTPNSELIAHINGNHYVTVTRIADGKIYYFEHNAGPQGEERSLTIDEFRNIFGGYVLTKNKPANEKKVISNTQAKLVKGAFFQFLIPLIAIIANVIGVVISGIALVIANIVAGIIAGIGLIVKGAILAVSHLVAGIGQGLYFSFQNLFAGVKFIGTSLFKGLSLLGGKLFAEGGLFAATSVTKASGVVGFLQGAFNNIIVQGGMNFLIAKGLEKAGLSPTLSNIGAAFITGGIQGFINPSAGISAIQSAVNTGVRFASMQGVKELGRNLGLDGPVAGILSLATGKLMQGEAFKQVFSTISGEFAYYGVTKLGEQIGIDPRINQILGIPISATISGITGDKTPQQIQDAVLDGLRRGVTSIAIEYVGQAIGASPLMTSLTARAVTGAIEGLLGGQNIFKGIADAFASSTGNLFGEPASGTGEAGSIARILELSQVIKERGLIPALEEYASSIFHRDSVEAIWKEGGIAELIKKRLAQGRVQDVTLNGDIKGKEVGLLDGISITITEDQTQLLGVTDKGIAREGTLKDGFFRYTLSDGTKLHVRVINGRIAYSRVISKYGVTTDVTELTPGRGVSISPTGDVTDGKLVVQSDVGKQEITLMHGEPTEVVTNNGTRISFSQNRITNVLLPPNVTTTADLASDPRFRNYTLGFGYRTNQEIAMDRAYKIEATKSMARDGDVIFTSNDDAFSIATKAGDFGWLKSQQNTTIVNHAGMIISRGERKYVMEMNIEGLRYVPLEEFIERYKDIEIVRPNERGEDTAKFLYKEYFTNKKNDFEIDKTVKYNFMGALLSIGNRDSAQKKSFICSEFIYHGFKGSLELQGKPNEDPLPGVLRDDRISPQDMWGYASSWGKVLVENISDDRKGSSK